MSRVDTLSTWDNLFPRGGPAPYVGNHCCRLNGSSMFIVRLFGDKVTEVFSTSELAQRSVQWVHVSGSSCSRQSLIHSASLLLWPPPLSLSPPLSLLLSLSLSLFSDSAAAPSAPQLSRSTALSHRRRHARTHTQSLTLSSHTHTHTLTRVRTQVKPPAVSHTAQRLFQAHTKCVLAEGWEVQRPGARAHRAA